mmetsp:Transcript_1415/g.2858  ORF Transcript_1415/g.2858 Transcript_1415/m.2858 type:complete len:220 (-) Transcript_1415:3178-3837(-)
METDGILGEAAGALNLLISQLSLRSTLGTARGQERILRIGFSTDGVEMHGRTIMRGRVMAGVQRNPRLRLLQGQQKLQSKHLPHLLRFNQAVNRVWCPPLNQLNHRFRVNRAMNRVKLLQLQQDQVCSLVKYPQNRRFQVKVHRMNQVQVHLSLRSLLLSLHWYHRLHLLHLEDQVYNQVQVQVHLIQQNLLDNPLSLQCLSLQLHVIRVSTTVLMLLK